MRMGTFLLGGIMGAVAVVYFNRNNGMMMTNLSEAGQTVGKMVNKARNSMANMDMGMNSANKGTGSTAGEKHSSTSEMNASSNASNVQSGMNAASGNTSSTHTPEHLAKVDAMVNKDPNVKQKVDEILNENKQTTLAYGMQ